MHRLDAPSSFTPESLLRAVRAERNLPPDPIPDVCVLEFDGDLTDWLVRKGRVRPHPSWACFHTSMQAMQVDGEAIGLVPRTIGGPYAVLVAEQLAASGARVILGLTSAGQVSPDPPVPSLVLPLSAIRDEGTSYHHLPPSETVDADQNLTAALQQELSGLGLFDRFYRIDEGRSREAGGVGLGLAVAKWGAEAHGGVLELDQTTQTGCIFRCVLPTTEVSNGRRVLQESIPALDPVSLSTRKEI